MLFAVPDIVYFGSLLVLMPFSLSLALAESKGDLAAVESFIDDEKPVLLSQALYVAVPKNNPDFYHGHLSQTPAIPSATELAMSALMEQRIREIFSRNDPKPAVSNVDDREVFKVQRTPDGKLSVVYNNTQITPPFVTGPDSEHDNGTPVAATPHSHSVRDIVFPTDATTGDFKPKCSQDSKDFCTEVENYPLYLLESILVSEAKKYEQLFGDDMVIEPPINLTQRIDVPGEEPLCQCLERLVYPQAGITKDNQWSIIVNHQNFTQGIRIEECKSPGSPCAMSESFPLGYKTECKQKYIYRQLLSLNPEGKMVKDLFKLPSCCKCVVQSSHRFRRDVDGNDRNRN